MARTMGACNEESDDIDENYDGSDVDDTDDNVYSDDDHENESSSKVDSERKKSNDIHDKQAALKRKASNYCNEYLPTRALVKPLKSFPGTFQCKSGQLLWGQMNCLFDALEGCIRKIPDSPNNRPGVQVGSIVQQKWQHVTDALKGTWYTSRILLADAVVGYIVHHEEAEVNHIMNEVMTMDKYGPKYGRESPLSPILRVQRYDWGYHQGTRRILNTLVNREERVSKRVRYIDSDASRENPKDKYVSSLMCHHAFLVDNSVGTCDKLSGLVQNLVPFRGDAMTLHDSNGNSFGTYMSCGGDYELGWLCYSQNGNGDKCMNMMKSRHVWADEVPNKNELVAFVYDAIYCGMEFDNNANLTVEGWPIVRYTNGVPVSRCMSFPTLSDIKFVYNSNTSLPRRGSLQLVPADPESGVYFKCNSTKFSTEIFIPFPYIEYAVFIPTGTSMQAKLLFKLKSSESVLLPSLENADFAKETINSFEIFVNVKSSTGNAVIFLSQAELKRERERVNGEVWYFCHTIEEATKLWHCRIKFETPRYEISPGLELCDTIVLHKNNPGEVAWSMVASADVEHVHFLFVPESFTGVEVIIIFKDFRTTPITIKPVPRRRLRVLKDWLSLFGISVTVGSVRKNWIRLMRSIASDPFFYLTEDKSKKPKSAGWDFLETAPEHRVFLSNFRCSSGQLVWGLTHCVLASLRSTWSSDDTRFVRQSTKHFVVDALRGLWKTSHIMQGSKLVGFIIHHIDANVDYIVTEVMKRGTDERMADIDESGCERSRWLRKELNEYKAPGLKSKRKKTLFKELIQKELRNLSDEEAKINLKKTAWRWAGCPLDFTQSMVHVKSDWCWDRENGELLQQLLVNGNYEHNSNSTVYTKNLVKKQFLLVDNTNCAHTSLANLVTVETKSCLDGTRRKEERMLSHADGCAFGVCLPQISPDTSQGWLCFSKNGKGDKIPNMMKRNHIQTGKVDSSKNELVAFVYDAVNCSMDFYSDDVLTIEGRRLTIGLDKWSLALLRVDDECDRIGRMGGHH